jgi:hypothetical protein
VRTAISRQPGPIMLHVQVLKEQGREGLAEEAEAALAVLLAPSLQPAALALEAARAAQVAENQRMAILGLGGLADSVALQAARATRIAENQARFASLGLGQATRDLADAVAAGKPKGGGSVKRKRPLEETSKRSLRQAGESATCIPR